MQTHTIRLKTLQKQQISLAIPSDYTLYQAKKQAARLCHQAPNKPISSFDVLLNGNKVLDLTRKISEIARGCSSFIEIIEKDYVQNDQYHYQQKAQFVITWESVSYSVSLSKKATILDLKNKTTEMLGLTSAYFVKYGEMEVPLNEPLSKYILCNHLKLEKSQSLEKTEKLEKTEEPAIEYFQKGARLVESVTSSEKENRDQDIEAIDGSSQATGNHALNAHQIKKSQIQTKKQEIARQNSLRDMALDDDLLTNLSSRNHKIVLKKSCSSINGSNIMVQSEKPISQNKMIDFLAFNQGMVQSQPQKCNLSALARKLESEAKQTYSVNSSTESDLLDFQELFINFINEDGSRCYTLECNRDMQLQKAVQKLAKLQKVSVQTIVLFHFQGKQSRFLKNSGMQLQDRKELIPEGMKVFELADPKQKEHTIYYRYGSVLEPEDDGEQGRVQLAELLKNKDKENLDTGNQDQLFVVEEERKTLEATNVSQLQDRRV